MGISSYSLFGLIAPIFYVIPTIVGGLIRPGYNHLYKAVSDLLTAGALNKKYMVPPFTIYPRLLNFRNIFNFHVISY